MVTINFSNMSYKLKQNSTMFFALIQVLNYCHHFHWHTGSLFQHKTFWGFHKCIRFLFLLKDRKLCLPWAHITPTQGGRWPWDALWLSSSVSQTSCDFGPVCCWTAHNVAKPNICVLEGCEPFHTITGANVNSVDPAWSVLLFFLLSSCVAVVLRCAQRHHLAARWGRRLLPLDAFCRYCLFPPAKQ